MSTSIGPLTNSIIDGIIKEIKKKKTKEKIMTHIVDPLLCDLTSRYYPHLMIVMIVLIMMIILLISILIMIMCSKFSS